MYPANDPIGLKFSHMGVTVTNMAVMEAFYQKVMGFIVTDRGHEGGMDLVFLSRSPDDHHQIILSTGRPSGLPQNTFNPQFGASINQISFKMNKLADMRKIKTRLEAEGATSVIAANHGNAWSLYAHDPEKNNLEFYVETPWYVNQPMFLPLDLSKSDNDIYDETLRVCETSKGYEPVAQWRARMSEKMVGL
jgi:catechol-2,3-dioxygenase